MRESGAWYSPISRRGWYTLDAMKVLVVEDEAPTAAFLPGGDGFSLCRRWRGAGITVPILFLTARDEVADRVRGLNLGGDDYLVKPFAFAELLARVGALVRRGQGAGASAE